MFWKIQQLYWPCFDIFKIFGQNRGSLSSTPTMAQNKKAPQEPYTEPFIHLTPLKEKRSRRGRVYSAFSQWLFFCLVVDNLTYWVLDHLETNLTVFSFRFWIPKAYFCTTPAMLGCGYCGRVHTFHRLNSLDSFLFRF